MKTIYPKLKSAPVVEAVFCLDFAGLPPLEPASVVVLMQKANEHYSKANDLVSHSLTIDMQAPTKDVKPDVIWSGTRFQCGNNNVVMLSNMDQQIVRFSYSRLAPYESWSAFIDVGHNLMEEVIDATRLDPIVKRLGVRFVNHFRNLSGDMKASDILLTLPPAASVPGEVVPGGFFYRDTSFYKEYNLHATSIKRTAREADGTPVVVVDFDVFTQPGIELSKIVWKPLLEKIHCLKNALFFGTVSKKAYSEVMHEE